MLNPRDRASSEAALAPEQPPWPNLPRPPASPCLEPAAPLASAGGRGGGKESKLTAAEGQGERLLGRSLQRGRGKEITKKKKKLIKKCHDMEPACSDSVHKNSSGCFAEPSCPPGALLRLSAWRGHQWARKVLTLMARAIAAAAGRDPGGPVRGEAKGVG